MMMCDESKHVTLDSTQVQGRPMYKYDGQRCSSIVGVGTKFNHEPHGGL